MNYDKKPCNFSSILLARKSIQNACDLLEGDFFFREVEAAKEKPSPGQATFLNAQTHCLGLSCAYLFKRSQIKSGLKTKRLNI